MQTNQVSPEITFPMTVTQKLLAAGVISQDSVVLANFGIMPDPLPAVHDL